jgi:hypothetical protein
MKQPVDRATVLVIAADACADPRTVLRELEAPGASRTNCIRDRIRAAIAKRNASSSERGRRTAHTNSQ